jgi:polyferredoxin
VAVVASFFVERAWCRYACPLGAVIGAVGRLSPVKIERDSTACLACGICTRQCPVGIPVERLTRVDSPECITCLECVGACPSQGGLQLKLALPGVAPRSGLVPAPAESLNGGRS